MSVATRPQLAHEAAADHAELEAELEAAALAELEGQSVVTSETPPVKVRVAPRVNDDVDLAYDPELQNMVKWAEAIGEKRELIENKLAHLGKGVASTKELQELADSHDAGLIARYLQARPPLRDSQRVIAIPLGASGLFLTKNGLATLDREWDQLRPARAGDTSFSASRLRDALAEAMASVADGFDPKHNPVAVADEVHAVWVGPLKRLWRSLFGFRPSPSNAAQTPARFAPRHRIAVPRGNTPKASPVADHAAKLNDSPVYAVESYFPGTGLG